jgi:thiol-disulfide isomerase/thioredoxin
MRCKVWWLAAALLACAPAFAGETPGKGAPPPALLGKDRDGQVVDLATMHGKVVIVTFWASWCGYCLKELPVLNALQARAGDDWLRIIAVNVMDDTADYRAMTRQMGSYKLTLTRDRNGRIAKGYGVEAYPNLWLIDRQGRVWGHHVGYGEDSLQTIVDEIQSLLKAEVEAPGATG